MNRKQNDKISKYLSFILRHKPDSIGLQLNENGWADIADLIRKTEDFNLNRDLIQFIVETNDKQRFKISTDGLFIKANQGHSIDINLDLNSQRPPDFLLHGTAMRFMESIKVSGLNKRNRHHVHLSENEHVAKAVGQRYGKVVVLKIDTKSMYLDGFEFYQTENNVWLVDSVPTKYIASL